MFVQVSPRDVKLGIAIAWPRLELIQTRDRCVSVIWNRMVKVRGKLGAASFIEGSFRSFRISLFLTTKEFLVRPLKYSCRWPYSFDSRMGHAVPN